MRGQGEKPDTVRVWDLAGNRTTSFDAGPFNAPAFGGGQGLLLSADGKRVALSRFMGRSAFGVVNPKGPPSPPDVTLWEWDPITGAKRKVFHRELPADANRGFGMVGFSNDGTIIALSRIDTVETPGQPLQGAPRCGQSTPKPAARTADHVRRCRDGQRHSPQSRRHAVRGHRSHPAADGAWNDQVVVWDLVRGTQVFAISANRIVSIGPAAEASAIASPTAVFWAPTARAWPL